MEKLYIWFVPELDMKITSNENADVLRMITEIFPEVTKQMDTILKMLDESGE